MLTSFHSFKSSDQTINPGQFFGGHLALIHATQGRNLIRSFMAPSLGQPYGSRGLIKESQSTFAFCSFLERLSHFKCIERPYQKYFRSNVFFKQFSFLKLTDTAWFIVLGIFCFQFFFLNAAKWLWSRLGTCGDDWLKISHCRWNTKYCKISPAVGYG